MDIALARTFLMVAETGSFIDAARKMNVTQSTVSARIKALEELFGRPLFERSKNGASLTGAGEQFQKHALALVRVWQHAQLEVGLSGPYRDHLAVGAHATLWDGFLLRWISWLRDNIPDIAISASRQPVRGDDPATAGGHARSCHHVPAGTAARPHHRAPVRRGVRAGHERARAQPPPPERLRVCRLGARLPGRARRRLPRAHQHGRQPGPGLPGPRFPARQRGVRLFPAPAGASVTSTDGACAFRPARAPSPIRSTWSIRKRATRRPTSRSLRVCVARPERLI